jgi:hypothetical protein
MLARKKSSRYINNYVESDNFSFTFNDAEDYAASEKWQKIDIYLIYCTISKGQSGAAVECARDRWIEPNLCCLVF